MKIGIAGKGGSGKSTLAALIIDCLLKNGKTPILAVDADPNHSLGEYLGLDKPSTLMEKMEELLQLKDKLPPGMDKALLWEMGIAEILQENKGFDLLTMGRTEGAGCYCTANNLLRTFMERLEKNYPFVVMDNEAGMEHLSRRTSRELDYLAIVANPFPHSLKSAERIWEISRDMDLEIKERILIMVETIPGEIKDPIKPFREIACTIPFDQEVLSRSLQNLPLLGIDSSSPAPRAVEKLVLELIAKN